MNESPGLRTLRLKQEAARVLRLHGLTLPYDAAELHLTHRHVYEPAGRRDVSDQLLDKMFPRLRDMDVWHFTKPEVLPLIVRSRSLRLYAVSKHLDGNEYRSFLREHGYAAGSSKQLRKELADRHFYVSCTEVGSESAESHWRVFADGGKGCHLRLRLTPKIGDLRRIRYGSPERALLTKIDAALREGIKRTFFPQGASRVAAYSLGSHLSYEDELRLLVSNPPEQTIIEDGGYRYIALSLNKDNDACRVDLLGITCGQAADVAVVRECAAECGFSDLHVDARAS